MMDILLVGVAVASAATRPDEVRISSYIRALSGCEKMAGGPDRKMLCTLEQVCSDTRPFIEAPSSPGCAQIGPHIAHGLANADGAQRGDGQYIHG